MHYPQGPPPSGSQKPPHHHMVTTLAAVIRSASPMLIGYSEYLRV
jgi:hypothetical protein